MIIDSERGRFLFKRRAHGKDDIEKVAFTHQIQLHLAGENFPLPHLISTRSDNNSMLVLNEHIYELFEFIQGQGYDGSLEATFDAGRTLGLYHKLLVNFQGDYDPPKGSYHGASAVGEAIRDTIPSLPLESRPEPDILLETVEFLERAYLRCTTEADKAGLKDWPAQIVHGDWHPGNMLFRDKLVAAVIDYDTARLQQRVIDLANGTIQFSIIGGSDDPSEWPDHPDKSRLKQFLLGYDSVNVISKAELQVVPFLMCEAMVAEAVLPIAATGSFGRMQGFPFLQMIQRKVRWVLDHLDEIASVLKD
ncbi:MAG: phosphotransferase [Planctomycetota bacterium]|nr:phosphotransferase [Planctomycetota bacterium]